MNLLIIIQMKLFFILSALLVSLYCSQDCQAANFYDNPPCQSTPIVKDYDGNVYNTVQIGNQCWMKENLRTTHYADGTTIKNVQEATDSDVDNTHYFAYPANNSTNKMLYGLLYSWYDVMKEDSSSNGIPSGVQGICPQGWHVPSKAEWENLTILRSEGVSSLVSQDWKEIKVNNYNGFSALPAGKCHGKYYGFGGGAYFWSATQYDADNYCNGHCARYVSLYRKRYSNEGLRWTPSYEGKDVFFSVRCLRD